jgi:hypothetical protein
LKSTVMIVRTFSSDNMRLTGSGSTGPRSGAAAR